MSNKNEKIVGVINQIVAEYKPQTFDWYEPSLDNNERISGILIDGFRKFVVPDAQMENGRRDRAIDGYFADNGRIGSHDLVFQPGLLNFLKKFIAESIGMTDLEMKTHGSVPGRVIFLPVSPPPPIQSWYPVCTIRSLSVPYPTWPNSWNGQTCSRNILNKA